MSFRRCKKLFPFALLLCLAATHAHAQVPAPQDTPYAPGAIAIHVDATDLERRIFRIRQEIPARPGPLTLLLPEWLPGHHSPTGAIDKIAGLRFRAGGRDLAWRRDPLNVYAFHLEVPQGADAVSAEFQFLSPTDASQGRVVMTPEMLNLQWIAMTLYPAGHYAARIEYRPSVAYPAGWQAASALDVERRAGDTVHYAPVPLDILADSPIFAGRHFRQFDLAPGARVPVRLNVVADAAKQLEAKPEHLERHRRLVQQILKLFGAQHYDHYDYLVALSKQLGGIGLEHQRSSENRLGTDYFTGWDEKIGSSDLLAHEFTHSWNGKFRRPANLWTPNYDVPMQDDLLWVYEGQTQYWGNVLNARAGLRDAEASREALASVLATYTDNRPGLQWRALVDTTHDPIIASRRPKPYRNYQLSEDYYAGGQLIWLEADLRIRRSSRGRKSLDDFALAFFGTDDGVWRTQKTYTFEDVAATLEGVVPGDWADFLHDRLEGRAPLSNALQGSGWRLAYRETPGAWGKARQKQSGGADFTYSLGLSLGRDGKVGDVRWDGPAFDAGIGSGMQLVAVNDVEYDKEVLEDAVKAAAAADARGPIRLLFKHFDRYRTFEIEYRGGLRHPYLERVSGEPDLLTAILAPRK